MRGSRFLLIATLLALLSAATAGGIGISFSYLIPRNGLFSHPVSPLSLRDIGFQLGRYFGLSGSLSLYSFAGMGLKDAGNQPIDTGGPAVGPFTSVLGSAVAKLILPMGNLELVGLGGLFGAFNINPPLMTGTLDRYLAGATSGVTYEAVTSRLTYNGRWGWGYLFGGSATYYLKGQFGLSLGALYYLGGADLKLAGTYDAYDADEGYGARLGQPLPAALRGARIDFTGLEILIGLSMRI